MDLEYIELYNQNVTENILLEAMNMCYNNICFSTFPYIEGKIVLSKESLEKNSSGNCIAMSTFIKLYLKKNYDIHSHIIISSVPDSWRSLGQSHICHCAIVIPKSKYTFYIIDCAFQLKFPLYVDVRLNSTNYSIMCDIHNDIEKSVNYSIFYEKRDDILQNTLCIKCLCNELEWTYYINEIKNPDRTIGNEYHNVKKEPFIVQTQVIDGKIIKKLHIKKELNKITFINKGDSKTYDLNNIPNEEKKILKSLYKYLRNTI